MGVVLVIVGFVFSTLVCGVGIIFLILGLVIWQREEDDAVPWPSTPSLQFPGGVRVRAARTWRRRRALRTVLVACVVVLAAVGGYLIYGQLARSHFMGLQISAPEADCWSGTVGSGGSPSGQSVGGCGPTSVPLPCTVAMWADLAKSTPGNWTFAVTGYRDGTSLGTVSVSGNLGVIRSFFEC